MTLYKWSQTAAADATADSTINWSEGQSPSSVNDSARAMMAATAKYRDDIAGAIVTGGTSTAYTISSYQVFDSYANMSGKMIAFTPHATNGDSPTLNVDGLGVRYLRGQTGINLSAGVLVAGTPYVALYSNSNTEFVLQGFFSNPYNIPIAGSLDYWGPTAPNSSFALPYGQAISRTTYATLFSLVGTTYGTGDGSTTFNLPDVRGRFIAGADAMGGVGASRLTSTYLGTSATLGATGGSQSHTLTLGELPTGITATGNFSVSGNVVTSDSQPANFSVGTGGTPFKAWAQSASLSTTTTNASGTTTSNNTGGNAHAIVPPTIIANKLIRII